MRRRLKKLLTSFHVDDEPTRNKSLMKRPQAEPVRVDVESGEPAAEENVKIAENMAEETSAEYEVKPKTLAGTTVICVAPIQ